MTLGTGTGSCPLIGWAVTQPSLDGSSAGPLRERACVRKQPSTETGRHRKAGVSFFLSVRARV